MSGDHLSKATVVPDTSGSASGELTSYDQIMANDPSEFDEEDEDVVIAGSELYEVLSKMGYTDYEVAPILHRESSPTPVTESEKPAGICEHLQNQLSGIYWCLTKDDEAVRKSIDIISESQNLLDDHTAQIKTLFDNCRQSDFRSLGSVLPYLQYSAAVAGVYCFVKNSNPYTLLSSVPVFLTVQHKYARWKTDRNLKILISEQSELHYTFKRALRILNNYYKINVGFNRAKSEFNNFVVEKIAFLQPITERALKSLGVISSSYYKTTLDLLKLIPKSYQDDADPWITYFEKDEFTNCGETSYERLKQLFYKYILVQSEMLLTLAVLVSQNKVFSICETIKYARFIDKRIEQLIELTKKHRIAMMTIVDDFNNCKLRTIQNKHRGFPGSKWQDLYVGLHMTSEKMEKAYNSLCSVLQDIESHLDRKTDETELLVTLTEKINDLCKGVDEMRDFAHLSSLIVTKMGKASSAGDRELAHDESTKSHQSDVRIIKDTDPEIIDEVFEEYIRERYSEAMLNEKKDDYEEVNHKLDKLVSKNLMSELREALIDKKKETEKRESEALERMKKMDLDSPEELTPRNQDSANLSTASDSESENDSKRCLHSVPLRLPAREDVKSEMRTSFEDAATTELLEPKVISIPPPPPPPPAMIPTFNQSIFDVAEEKTKDNEHDSEFRCRVPLPTPRSFILPTFLSNNEETFIGSGENSEEELVESEPEDEEKVED
ncbi:uncharacterized protein LOC105684341 isoform X2 [Athalia rosae]|uniref:uncharacterized protein LOC105684341 isoform X2 n=1 Tax=Athalia rosae TaxID=37344 RepID=UPI0020339F14|nr:uncharacterized protein LOC105684341 isoform X2 [Athalia rosae]